MNKGNERLTERLTAISSARPVEGPPPRQGFKSRRSEPREPTYRFARVIIGDQTVICCIIKDMSPSGVRITMEGAVDLPEQLILAIDQSGRRYRARVAWRREQEAGLSLLAELAPQTRMRLAPRC